MSPVEIAKDWWSRLVKYTRVVTAISVTAAAVIGVMNAGGVLEPMWIATRGYTRSVVAKSENRTSIKLLEIEMATRELARDNTQNQIDRLEVELKKNDTASDAVKQILNEQIVKYRSQLKSIDYQIEALKHKQSALR